VCREKGEESEQQIIRTIRETWRIATRGWGS